MFRALRAAAPNRNDAALVAVALALLAWPFTLEPGAVFYIRYFDTDTLFNPWWSLRRLFETWNDDLHLGFASEINLSYVSVPMLASVVLSFAGPVLMSRLAPLTMIAFSFAAMFAYLRRTFARSPAYVAVLPAFLYACNPYAMTLVHDGYAGILVYYALFPVTLMIADAAERRNRPSLVAFVFVAYALASYFTYPAVAINLMALVALRHRYLLRVLRSSSSARVAVAGSLLLTAFWLVPLVVDLRLHPFVPILSESQGDIDRISQYATLSNVVLLRSYSEIWTHYDVPECSACAWYVTPGYVAGALTVAALAAIGLWRTRRRDLVWTTLGALVLATGFHYQDDLIGIPYQWLMSLPIFGLFRGANLFVSIVAFGYAVGLAATLSIAPSRRLLAFATISIALVGLPVIDGAYIERSPAEAAGVRRFPNFPVRVPAAYRELKRRTDALSRADVTLLLPAMPFAKYRWGAYGNDFLMPFLDRPTLSQFLWPQPNLQLQQKLDELTSDAVDRDDAGALMRVMRLGQAVVHDDVVDVPPVRAATYGRTIWRSDRLALVRAYRPALPRYQGYDAIARDASARGIERYAALFGRPAMLAAAAEVACPSRAPLAITDFPDRIPPATRITIATGIPCSGRFRASFLARASGTNAPTVSVVRAGRNERVAMRPVAGYARHDGTMLVSGDVTLDPSSKIAIANLAGTRRPLLLALGEDPESALKSDRALVAPAFVLRAVGRLHVPAGVSVVESNASFDPVWVGLDATRAGTFVAAKHVANGYATAWDVEAGSDVYFVNLAQLAFFVGSFLTAVGIVLVVVAVRRDRGLIR